MKKGRFIFASFKKNFLEQKKNVRGAKDKTEDLRKI